MKNSIIDWQECITHTKKLFLQWIQDPYNIYKEILGTMVLYWKPLTIVTNSFIIDVDRDPGFISALLLLLWIIQFAAKCLSFFSLTKLMTFTLQTNLTIPCILLFNPNFYFCFQGEVYSWVHFFHSIWVYWR